jgi:outer membrane protein OmpA-like peptidoglycan-associated protein
VEKFHLFVALASFLTSIALIGLIYLIWDLRDTNRELTKVGRDLVTVSQGRADEHVKAATGNLFKGTSLTPQEVEKIANGLVSSMAQVFANDHDGEIRRKFEDYLAAVRTPGTPPAEVASKLAAIRPFIDGAAAAAIGLANLPVEKANSALNFVQSMGSDLWSGFWKAAGESGFKAMFGSSTIQNGTPIPVTCNCGRSDDKEQPIVPPPLIAIRKSVAVSFRTDQSAVADEGQIEQVWRALALHRAQPERMLLLSAHTDSTGSAEYNARLATKRADSVSRALERVGVPKEKIRRTPTDPLKPPVLVAGQQRIPSNRVVLIEIP